MDCRPQHWWILKVYLGAFAPWFRLLRSCWWLKSIPSGNPSIGWKKPYLFRWQMVLLRSFRSACSLKFNRSNKINKRFLFHRSDRWWPDLPALPGLRTSDRQTQVRAQGAMMGLENTFVPTLCQLCANFVPTCANFDEVAFIKLWQAMPNARIFKPTPCLFYDSWCTWLANCRIALVHGSQSRDALME